MVKQVRTWIYWNGWTKVTIKLGQTLRLEHSEPTDEGWSYREINLVFDGKMLELHRYSGGSDCDGRIDHYVWKSCHYRNLQDINNDIGVVHYNLGRYKSPIDGKYRENSYEIGAIHNWKEEDRRQRDHTAERMGY